MSDPFNPTSDYVPPKSESRYMKLEEGANEFLALQSPIIGYEYWNKEGKPVRLTVKPEETPEDIRIDQKTGQPEAIKHFWAFAVIDVADGKVKILEITQKTIQKAIRALVVSKWGNPLMKYTVTVTRDDTTTPTTYNTMPNPAEELPASWLKAWDDTLAKGFDINALFTNDDPFSAKTPVGAGMSQAEAEKVFDGGAEDTQAPPDEEATIHVD